MKAAPPKLVVLLSSTSIALALGFVVLAYVAHRAISLPRDLGDSLDDPRVRAAVVDRLATRSGGIFDSHPDPLVAKSNLPRLRDRETFMTSISTNRFGMREREYEMPKPPGTVRVVVLGDSFVFGTGAAAEDRMGVFLERYLAERARGFEGEIEVLHLAVVSWNGVGECAYVRRQLGDLLPDLVVHFFCTNDLDDSSTARGFGGLAAITPRHPQRANVQVKHASGGPALMLHGADWESRHRYEELAAACGRLDRAVRAYGGHYLVAINMPGWRIPLVDFLEPYLDREQIVLLPPHVTLDVAYQVAEDDRHWNRRGHEALGRILYGAIRSADLLPSLDLEPWPEVEQETARWRAKEWEDLRPPLQPFLAGALAFPKPGPLFPSQVYAGLDEDGVAGPYVSLALKAGAPGVLRVAGRGLDRLELGDLRVAVHVEELRVGELEPRPGEPFTGEWPLPPELVDRPLLSVRFEADDWVYAGGELRECVSFRLTSVAIE